VKVGEVKGRLGKALIWYGISPQRGTVDSNQSIGGGIFSKKVVKRERGRNKLNSQKKKG